MGQSEGESKALALPLMLVPAILWAALKSESNRKMVEPSLSLVSHVSCGHRQKDKRLRSRPSANQLAALNWIANSLQVAWLEIVVDYGFRDDYYGDGARRDDDYDDDYDHLSRYHCCWSCWSGCGQ